MNPTIIDVGTFVPISGTASDKIGATNLTQSEDHKPRASQGDHKGDHPKPAGGVYLPQVQPNQADQNQNLTRQEQDSHDFLNRRITVGITRLSSSQAKNIAQDQE
jgi:hypothetical protein